MVFFELTESALCYTYRVLLALAAIVVIGGCTQNCEKLLEQPMGGGSLLSHEEIMRRVSDAELPNNTGNDAFYIYQHIESGGDTAGLPNGDAMFWLNKSADQGLLNARQVRIVYNLNKKDRLHCNMAINEINQLAKSYENIKHTISQTSVNDCVNILSESSNQR